MSKSVRHLASVFVFQDPYSHEIAESLMRQLEEHFTMYPSAPVLVDCSKIGKLSTQQINFLSQIFNRYGDDCIRLILKPGQEPMGDERESLSKSDFWESLAKKSFEENSQDIPVDAQLTVGKYEDEMHPAISEVTAACARLDLFLSDLQFDPKTYYILRTIFYEFVSNICLHSGMSGQDKLSITITVSHQSVSMTFVDTGRRFNLAGQVNGPYLNSLGEGERLSFGINLIKTLSSSIEYERTEDSRNATTIVYERCKK